MNSFERFLLVTLALSVLCGCPRRQIDLCSGDDPHPECDRCEKANPDPECPNFDMGGGDMPVEDMDVPDGDVPDDGPDLMLPCNGECSGDTGFCDEDTNTCVACLVSEDCGDDVCTDDNRCVECVETTDCDTGVCDTTTNLCVACLANDDCTDPTASLCDAASNTCVSCTASTDCGHLTDTTICDLSGAEGVCVECLDDDDTTRMPCMGNSCDPATNTCTQTPTESVGTCGSCVADSECATDFRCVPLDYMGAFEGNYCLQTVASAPSSVCPAPYRAPVTKSSLSGAPSEQYCGVAELLTTCPAVRDMVDETACATAAECGNGGRCETIPGLGMICTINCDASGQCTSSLTCNDTYCDAP